MLSPLKTLAGVLLVGAIALAVLASWNDSLTYDEVAHVGAGYSYLVTGDMRLNPEHPPLAKDLAALPLLFINLNQGAFGLPEWRNSHKEDNYAQWRFGRSLLFGEGTNGQLATRLVHLPLLIFFISAALLVFRWTNILYGPAAALIALIAFLFSPTILAHSRLVTTDVPALWGILAASFYFVRFIKKPTDHNLLVVSLVTGVALLTKFSMILLLPLFFFVALLYGGAHTIHLGKKLIGKTIFLFLISFVFVVWPIYGLHVWHYPPTLQQSDTREVLETFGNRPLANAAIWIADKPYVRALGHYSLGVLTATQRASGGNTTYFLGEIQSGGSPWYFPVVYFIKEPLAWWFLVFIAVVWASFHLKNSHMSWHNIRSWIVLNPGPFLIVSWLTLYWFMSIRSPLNIGIRHLLPIYPFMIILVAGQVARAAHFLRLTDVPRLKIYATVIGLLMGWYVYESVSVHPHYLSYFNQAAGGPVGGRNFVTDSNLDWGQELKRLSNWVKENDIEKIELDYFGWAPPEYYLGDRFVGTYAGKYKNLSDFKKRNRTNGWIAVSATFFQESIISGKSDSYAWLNSIEPKTIIGNSILVWEVK